MCPESGQAPQECCLRVSLMPLRLNIDQVKDRDDFSSKIYQRYISGVAHSVDHVPCMKA